MTTPTKTRVRLALSCFVILAALIFVFMQSSNRVREAHEGVINRLAKSRALDGNFRLEAFRVRTFLSPDYDALVRGAGALLAQCESMTHGSEKITGRYGDDFDKLLMDYCDGVHARIELSEELKSTVSIVRNSARYIPTLSSKPIFAEESDEEKLATALLVSSLAYLADSNVDTYARVLGDISAIERYKGTVRSIDPVSKELLQHAKAISTLLPKVDSVLSQLVDKESRERMLAIQPAYLAKYAHIEQKALLFQQLLLFASIGILIFAGVLLVKLRKAADALGAANLNLEERVTERTQELNETLQIVTEQQAAIAQSSKLSALGEMAGGIAHEINTPLATISLGVQNLRMMLHPAASNADFMRELFDTMEGTIERIGKIINGLRKISRDEALEEPVPSKILEILTDTCSLCQERFSAHGTELTIKAFDENLSLKCRPVQISQVLLNLLNNSFDALQTLDIKWIRIEVLKIDESVQIAVIDSGAGITAAVRAKIMQPFFTTKPVGKGTGLGLSLSASILRTHGGELVLDDTCANTKFILTFPTERDQMAA